MPENIQIAPPQKKTSWAGLGQAQQKLELETWFCHIYDLLQ